MQHEDVKRNVHTQFCENSWKGKKPLENSKRRRRPNINTDLKNKTEYHRWHSSGSRGEKKSVSNTILNTKLHIMEEFFWLTVIITLFHGDRYVNVCECLTFRGPCIVIYSCNKSQKDALFLYFISVKNSTYFGQVYCPSSGVFILYSRL